MSTDRRPTQPAARAARPRSWGLWLLYAFTAVALAGYATFGRNPELLARWPELAGFYGVSFRFFAQAQVWIAGVVFAVFLVRHVGWRWLPALAALYAISLASELGGTLFGVPFGEYRYHEMLAPMWLEHVPLMIPLSWFFMAVPSYAFARLLYPDRALARVGFASLVLLAWDLALDPAMSFATPYWTWAREGVYYGMPLSNLFGWYVTGLALMGALVALRADRWIERLPVGWLVGFYGANLLLPLGMSAAAGLWGAVLATGAVLAVLALLVRWRRAPAAAPSARPPVPAMARRAGG